MDIQADFTQAMQSSLAVGGADREYLDAAEIETSRLKALGYPIYATQDWQRIVASRPRSWMLRCSGLT